VHCDFDNDKGGDTLWARVQEAYPRAEAIVREKPPAGVKDWNDALRASNEPDAVRAREEKEHARGKGVIFRDKWRNFFSDIWPDGEPLPEATNLP